MVWLLFAQTADPISGGAGWVGAGLLGLVLSWLLFRHLPDKDKQIKTLVDEYNLAIDKLHEDCAEERRQQFTYFNETLNKILDRHSKDLEPLRDEMEALKHAITALGNAVQMFQHSAGKSNAESHRSKPST